MKIPKRETMMEAAKNMGTTFLVFGVFIILLIIINIIKNRGFLADIITDTTIIFLAILPFIIYLAVSGKISEFKGGGFEIKFNNASNAEVFKSEEVVPTEAKVIAKEGERMLMEKIMPEMAKKLTSARHSLIF